MTHASLFSGIGGAEVAAAMLGWENLGKTFNLSSESEALSLMEELSGCKVLPVVFPYSGYNNYYIIVIR